jgi:tetratricopeptide (TPR) repeat protein
MLISALLVVAAMGQMSGETAFLSGDAAQRSGQWAAAVPQFEQAAADPLLKPYAELRIAESMQHTGDYTGAMARCKAVIEQAPQGPWTAIAQMRLAEAMASQGQLAESARLHDGFIKLPVEPWWLADLAKTNGLLQEDCPLQHLPEGAHCRCTAALGFKAWRRYGRCRLGLLPFRLARRGRENAYPDRRAGHVSRSQRHKRG